MFFKFLDLSAQPFPTFLATASQIVMRRQISEVIKTNFFDARKSQKQMRRQISEVIRTNFFDIRKSQKQMRRHLFFVPDFCAPDRRPSKKAAESFSRWKIGAGADWCFSKLFAFREIPAPLSQAKNKAIRTSFGEKWFRVLIKASHFWFIFFSCDGGAGVIQYYDKHRMFHAEKKGAPDGGPLFSWFRWSVQTESKE